MRFLGSSATTVTPPVHTKRGTHTRMRVRPSGSLFGTIPTTTLRFVTQGPASSSPCPYEIVPGIPWRLEGQEKDGRLWYG